MIRDGRLRGFAFIGFTSNRDAKEAVKYFDRTFLDTSRLQVELAKPVGDPTLDRPWSKYSRGSSSFTSLNAEEESKKSPSQLAQEKQKMKEELERKKKFLLSIYGSGESDKVDSELERFLAAMKSKGKTKTWENDDDAFGAPQKENKVKKAPKVKKINVEAVPSRKAGANGALVEQVHLTFDSDSSSSEGEDDYKKAFGGESQSEDDLYDEAGPIDEDHLENDPDVPAEAVAEDEDKNDVKKEKLSPEMIAETGRLFVRNLSYACTEDDLRELFEPYGPITELHLPISKETKKPKGFAYVLYMIPEHALRAFSELDGSIFQGRLLHVLPSHEKPSNEDNGNDGKNSSFKAKKEKELKESSGKDFNWNSLFIRSDTILDAIAHQLGVSKGQIMDPRADSSLATRLALAETHLIQETKDYLESQGVCLDAFQGKPKERSDHIILVKNLPFDTDSKEIRRLFAKHGNLGRVVLPPATKAIAMVEFLEASEARTAFRNLAYTKFKNVPLYLEWAPMHALKARSKEQEADQSEAEDPQDPQEGEVVRVKALKAEDLVKPLETAVEDASPTSNTLYVTNINWSTPADTLKQIFSSAGQVKSVKLATKKKGTETVSLGFGFVEFDHRASLNRALDTLQGVVVDGHELVLKRSTNNNNNNNMTQTQSSKRKQTQAEPEIPENGTKLIVRNVPFEATEKELRDLFRSFSQLKRVRLPRKFDGQHRGFAFLDFLTHQDARTALQSLSHTHLYGRHLVLEWAKAEAEVPEEEVEAQRRKMASRAIDTNGARTAAKRARTKADRIDLDQDADADQLDG